MAAFSLHTPLIRLVVGMGGVVLGLLGGPGGVGLAEAAATCDDTCLVRTLPRIFCGSFSWLADPVAQRLVFTFESAKSAGGTVRLAGHGVYAVDAETHVALDATLDPVTLTIEIHEHDPDRGSFTTAGAYRGSLSADLKTIRATWTSTDTSARGSLLLDTNCGPIS
ncbi:MAG TPA: hypothetical protein VNT30_02685 [Stellaceae bacterium]|nr:hypothetical protein [Stellaceae bacterium]